MSLWFIYGYLNIDNRYLEIAFIIYIQIFQIYGLFNFIDIEVILIKFLFIICRHFQKVNMTNVNKK